LPIRPAVLCGAQRRTEKVEKVKEDPHTPIMILQINHLK
jgi:hypothetical protein